MNNLEPSVVVYSRLQALDPENASKIMGYILIHGPSEADFMSLAVAPDAALQQLIDKGKTYSRILTGSSPTSPSPRSVYGFNPLSNSSPRFPPNGFALGCSNLQSPRQQQQQVQQPQLGGGSSRASPSYAAVVNAGNGNGSGSGSSSLSASGSGQFQISGVDVDGELEEDYGVGSGGVPDNLSFVNEQQQQQKKKRDELQYDLDGGSPRSFHKRSLSLSDVYGGGEMNGGGLGLGWRSCMYFARGFCKNGSSCKFLHSGFGRDDDDDDSGAHVLAALDSSAGKFDGFEQELLRTRATQQQRLAIANQIMPSNSFPYNKYLNDSPRSVAASMMMGEELCKLGQLRHDRSDFLLMGCSSSSRQIYLTFPADSTFREEDVSNYFSIYGPVQDVRIPYQPKRMFGFVTFVHPETVKIILAKGSPHFVCDSRVLVKPYKEKGKVDKKHLLAQQQQERGDLSSCPSSHGFDIRDFDVRVGPRMFYHNAQEMMMRRKLEEAEFQQALEIQSRKMANLQLMDLKNIPCCHPFSLSLSPGAAISPPTHSHPLLSPNHMRSYSGMNREAFEETNTAPTLSLPPNALVNRLTPLEKYANHINCNEQLVNNTNDIRKFIDTASSESLVLPDSLDDTIPSRSSAGHQSFSSGMLSVNVNTGPSSSPSFAENGSIDSSACLSNIAPPKSRFLEDPSFASGAIGVMER